MNSQTKKKAIGTPRPIPWLIWLAEAVPIGEKADGFSKIPVLFLEHFLKF